MRMNVGYFQIRTTADEDFERWANKMRLIDADLLLQRIAESREKNPHGDSKIRANHTIEHDHIADLVSEQPTDYDVDRVVEQLEAESKRWKESGEEYDDQKELGVSEGLMRAIEIVKSVRPPKLKEKGEYIGESMLIFDTPKGCAMCPAFYEDPDANPNFTYYCGAARKYMNYRECYDVPNASAVRPDWCPIIEAR